jgi:hypothetical protein
MTAAAQIGREVDAAAEAMIRSHREWYDQAVAEVERRLAAVEQRERERGLAEAERWINERRERIERAIAANA